VAGYPGVEPEEPEWRVGARQDNGNDGKSAVTTFFPLLAYEGQIQLSALPFPQSIDPDEYGHSIALLQDLFEGLLPGKTGCQRPSVEKHSHPTIEESTAYPLNGRTVV
jgi:hypothetical protein